ncbi:MAG: dTDP-glucose 4,6-dehydratase [Candidatus Pacebacteria bacterium]|nr:dTDP-glucose 4,6-dehydratase [Candidatus Paceibacterota bacterium]
MKLLVTGGAGFIGSNFIRYWVKKYSNDSIINLDKLTYAGNLENLKEVENLSNYKFIQGDICDLSLLDKLAYQVDTIVHFAAESHVDRSILSSADFVKTNIEGTRVLLDIALKHKIGRFHHVSTDEVFGSLDLDSEPFSETTPYDPRSPYSASKAGSDHLVRAYFHTHKLSVTISNCSNNFGPYQHVEKLIPRFITNLLQDKKIPVYGQGKNIRDWLHVEDHVKGIEAILQKGRLGQTYCLGGNQEKTNLEITKDILRLMDKSEDYIDYVDDRPGHDLRYAISFEKAQKELGWEPKIEFEQGLQATINWYRNNVLWWQKLK